MQDSKLATIAFAFHADQHLAVSDALEAIQRSGYRLTSESYVWRHERFVVCHFERWTDEEQRDSRILAVSTHEWPDDPFNGDWHNNEGESDESGDLKPMPIVLRLDHARIPGFLFPALVPENSQFCNIIDAELTPSRVSASLLEKLGLRESSEGIRLAEAILIQLEWSARLLGELTKEKYVATEADLQNIDPGLGADLRSALAAILRCDARALKSILSGVAGERLIQARLAGDYSLLHVACNVPGSSAVVEALIQCGADVNRMNRVGATALYHALWSDVNVAELLLHNGAESGYVSLEGDTPLSVAAWLGYTEIAREFLARGADAFITDRNQGHSLIWAAQAGHIEVVDAILAHFPGKIDVPSGDRGLGSNDPYFSVDAAGITDFVRYRREQVAAGKLGRTALMAAAGAGKPHIVEHLLKAGADVNLSDRSGMAALHHATNENAAALETVKSLLRWHPAIDKVDDDGETALSYATRIEHLPIMTAFLDEGADPEVEDNGGFTSLHLAASWGHTEAVKALCDQGDADPEHFDRNGFAALHLAVSFKESGTDVIEALIDGGSSPNLLTKDGRTPLWVLVGSRDRDGGDKVAIGKFLIEKGADVWATNSDGQVAVVNAGLTGYEDFARLAFSTVDLSPQERDPGLAISCATALGDVDLVSSLLEAGGPINTCTYLYFRPLAIAALRGHLALVDKLLSHGADVNWAVKYQSALASAAESGHLGVVSRLLAAGANPNAPSGPVSPLFVAVSAGNIDIVDRLLLAGAYPSPRTPNGLIRPRIPGGFTPLHQAAGLGRGDLARRLLDKGAEIDALDEDGDTPLHIAAMADQSELVILLLERKASPDTPNEEGRRPLHFAAERGMLGAVIGLAKAGSDLESTDRQGNSPLHYAAMNGRTSVVEWLLEKKVALDAENVQGLRAADISIGDGVISLFRQRGITSVVERLRESERATFLAWEVMPTKSIRLLKRLVSRELKDQDILQALNGAGEAQVRGARLPFYDRAMLIAIPVIGRRPPNEIFLIVSEGGFAVRLDWTNEPIYRCNERLKWSVNAKTAILYLKFLFFFVRGVLGRFVIVESASDLAWLATAPGETSSSVEALIHPVSLKEPAPPGMRCFVLTCSFKNALFEAEAYLALSPLMHTWPDEENPTTLSLGQFELRNERLLMEELPIEIPGPPSEFG